MKKFDMDYFSPAFSAGFSSAAFPGVVCADHEHALRALDLLDGSPGHQDGVLDGFGGDPHPAKLAGAQEPIGVRELGDEG
jgi:hypothetical protein